MLFCGKKTIPMRRLANFAAQNMITYMRYLCLFALTALLFTCASDPTSEWSDLDLMQYNIPVTISAPDSAKVAASTFSGLMQDVTITSPADNYAVQVFASQASTNDMARLKAEQLELVRENRYFAAIVQEDTDGFIFENKIDSTSIYGFRHIVYQGDKEIVFQNSFESTFTLPQVEKMYAAVK